jgi:hypothetical protein
MAGSRNSIVIAAAGLLALGACAHSTSWDREAGAVIIDGGFGQATRNNMLAQKCLSGGYLAKGQIIYEPKVVRAPVHAPAPYVRQVHCGGYLNGKYAQVIFQEYVASATELPPVGADGAGIAP